MEPLGTLIPVELDDGGNIEAVVRYSGAVGGRRIVMGDFRPLDEGLYFPFSISIEDNRGALFIRYSSVELDPELDDALFTHPVSGQSGKEE